MTATRAGGGRRLPAAAGGLAAALALVLYVWGPPGGDAAAHLYLTELWDRSGWQLWDNLWYSGRHSLVTLSVLYYPLAGLVGAGVVVTVSAGVAAAAFAWIARTTWPRGAAPATLAFALVMPAATVVAGTYPFLVGLAAGLVCLAAVRAGRPAAAAVLALVTTLAHPLAFAFVVLVLAAVAWERRAALAETRWRLFAAAVAATLAGQYLLVRTFAGEGGGRYPFDPKDAVAIIAFCVAGAALAWRPPGARVLRGVFVGYGLLALAALVVPTPVGGNAVRLMVVAGAALLLLVAAERGGRPRPVIAACLAGTLVWQVLPTVTGWRTAARASAADAAYWDPVVEAATRLGDPGHRIHVVATADNWEAYHVARRGIPLTRGWFRQDDHPPNAILYERPLTPARYREWMRQAAVRYVFLPDDPLDYTSTEEAALLRGGRSGLRVVERTDHWTVYRLDDALPVGTPAGGVAVTRLTSEAMTVRVRRPGVYRLSLRYTVHMRATADTAGACLAPAAPWGTTLRAERPGTVTLRLDVTATSVARAVLGRRGECPGDPR